MEIHGDPAQSESDYSEYSCVSNMDAGNFLNPDDMDVTSQIRTYKTEQRLRAVAPGLDLAKESEPG